MRSRSRRLSLRSETYYWKTNAKKDDYNLAEQLYTFTETQWWVLKSIKYLLFSIKHHDLTRYIEIVKRREFTYNCDMPNVFLVTKSNYQLVRFISELLLAFCLETLEENKFWMLNINAIPYLPRENDKANIEFRLNDAPLYKHASLLNCTIKRSNFENCSRKM
jgi:hypothetical protein